MTRHQINLRMPDAESIEDVKQKAKAAGLPVAEFVRRAIDGRRTASVVDRQMVGELRRLGALLKHRYPKDSNWSLEEKREYWAQMERITALAGELEALIRGRQD
ncbi:MAG: hypothetical protein P8011_05525 [Acidihalobacter sp.]|uniref:plasmid mobilization protein n=1 Tax=Acidihalobacter sp. TaxID=1872108 RepID=UPI00307F3FD6